jgi:hypothetical protein
MNKKATLNRAWLLLPVLPLSALAWLVVTRGGGRTLFSAEPAADSPTFLLELADGRPSREVGVQTVALPEGAPTVGGEEELRRYVEWLRSLGHEELLRLSNAEFEFLESELIEHLRGLTGPWVVEVLGELAGAEKDPLLKAILVEGLLGGVNLERLKDPRLLPVLDTLVLQYSRVAEDPYSVAGTTASSAYMACASGKVDYPRFMAVHLAAADNPELLRVGYMFMAHFESGPEVVAAMLTMHPHESGRFGALEGLRGSATRGLTSPQQIYALGTRALELETHERNRFLLYEMLASTGGDEGHAWLEERIRAGDGETIQKALTFLTLEAEPTRSLVLLQELYVREDLGPENRAAVLNALGALPGSEGRDLLLSMVDDDTLDEEARLAGLRGLWNQPLDEPLTESLTTLLRGNSPATMRIEALRMMASSESLPSGIDLREIGAQDDDPSVRAEAVQLAAMQSGEDPRAWLEERLLLDDSPDVKAAALGAMVYRAHYEGNGEDVLGYLGMARKLTDDENTLALISEGERMVSSHDPRRMELELAEEAEFFAVLARHTTGPAARGFDRQARLLGRIVQSLRPAGR